MYPPQFDHETAESAEHAVELLETNDDRDVKVLAGGHSLIPMMKTGLATPDLLIDISRLSELSGIERTDDGFEIGATTNYAPVAKSDELHDEATAFAEAAENIGDRQVRNRGTVGGNIAHADPASDLPAALLAHGGSVTITGSDGDRTVDADEFFYGMYETDVGPAELVTSITVPAHGPNAVSTYEKDRSPASGYAIVGVAVVLEADDGTIVDAAVTANGAMDRPSRLSAVEEALEGSEATEAAVEAAAERAGESLNTAMMMSDQDASPEFREQKLKVYSKRALTRAVSQL
ncbi:FAD binding domain-containing protein [Natrarchaeobius oligotrophus]|uniref:Xanthine dehydrogenase family protein subunit M n=1 Tax=Natrarchaeobius chitinivorans TaxID=1679083 RepID=A0A3N6MEY9_NATCH|nr:xanthine dehydrogenase family protein subunit M [Natrarchaeobius chitinivorans]RQG99444.1 xanthine dehydrogenase family protein subunit M [Natrarchaeobius chitinivorans]